MAGVHEVKLTKSTFVKYKSVCFKASRQQHLCREENVVSCRDLRLSSFFFLFFPPRKVEKGGGRGRVGG